MIKQIITSILVWKLPIFQGFVLMMGAVAATVTAGVQDYKTMTDIDQLVWFKILWSSVASSSVSIIAFLNGSFHRTNEQQKKANETQSITRVDPRPPVA